MLGSASKPEPQDHLPLRCDDAQPGQSIVADLASMYRTLWRGDRPDRDVVLEILRDGAPMRLSVHAVDRMMTLSRPRGV